MLIGDLNVNLKSSRVKRDKAIAKYVDTMDLINMTRQFKQYCRR